MNHQIQAMSYPPRTKDSTQSNQDLSEELPSLKDMIMLEELDNSTHQSEIISDQIDLNPVYRLNSQILQNTQITENIRARIRSFLMNEASRQVLYRDTYVLASNYLDLYLLNKGVISVNDFQSLAIGCLILATKINQGKAPIIKYDIFSRQQLLNYQRNIAKRLNYFLNPITYDYYSQRVVSMWDRFVQNENMYNIRFNEQQSGVNVKLRTFHEQLDCVYLVLKSLDYHPQVLTVNLFYLNAMKLHYPQIIKAQNLTETQFTQIYYCALHPFYIFFQRFLTFYSRRHIQLDIELGKFLKNFLDVVPASTKWMVRGIEEVVQKFRQFDRLQTLPKDCYVLAKSVISKIKK